MVEFRPIALRSTRRMIMVMFLGSSENRAASKLLKASIIHAAINFIIYDCNLPRDSYRATFAAELDQSI